MPPLPVIEILGPFLQGCLVAVAVALCQLSVGRWICRRLGATLSTPAAWAMGVVSLALLNTLELALGLGMLMHLNLLWALGCLAGRDPRTLFRLPTGFKPGIAALPLILLFIVLLSSVANPVISWDAQCSYLALAKDWAEQGSLEARNSIHLFNSRPQLISSVYAWCFLWDGEDAAQALDLGFFCALVLWCARRGRLGPIKTFLLVLLVSTTEWITPLGAGHEGGRSRFFWFVGSGGNDLFMALLACSLFEALEGIQKSPWPLGILGAGLITARWTGHSLVWPLLAIALAWKLPRGALLRSFLVALGLSLPWSLWNIMEHGNLFYPNFVAELGGRPLNSLLLSDYGVLAKSPLRGLQGLRNLADLSQYAWNIGPVLFLVPLVFLKALQPADRRLRLFFVVQTALTALITAQPRFQYVNFFVLGALVLGSPDITRAGRMAVELCIGILSMLSLSPFYSVCRSAYDLAKDARHGQDYLLENRIRLYNAAKWLNAQDVAASTGVLWPMSPHFYLRLTPWRADETAYILPETLLADPRGASEYFKSRGVRFIVSASPMYDTNMERGPRHMETQVQWMLLNDTDWVLAASLPKSGVSPPVLIYTLKRP